MRHSIISLKNVSSFFMFAVWKSMCISFICYHPKPCMIYYCASFSLFPFPSPPAPAARVTRRRLGTSQVVFSLPASRVDFDVLEDDCMTQPHFLQSSLKKAKEYFEASCNVKVIFYAANMKYYLETLRHGSFEYEHWGAYATTTATGKKTSLKNGNSPYFKLHRA